ncbi:4803_t:CDS:2, partial [Cetraspora pellucida]
NEMPIFYKKLRTSNIYKEETSLSSGPSKSLLKQTKAQVLNSQEPKALSTQKTQEAYIVIDLKISKALNKENTDLVKNNNALFTSANNIYTEPQIKTKTAEKEPTEDTSKKLNNSLIENHIIDTNIIVNLLIILYNDSKAAKSSFISNNNNEFQLVVSKKKHKEFWS